VRKRRPIEADFTLDTPLQQLPLPTRLINYLSRVDCKTGPCQTLGNARRLSTSEWMAMKGFGPKSLETLYAAILEAERRQPAWRPVPGMPGVERDMKRPEVIRKVY
jgi:hypothetical protein